VQSVVSGDAIIQASATIVVGMIFLVTLRQALKLPNTSSDLKPLAYAAVALLFASDLSFFMENPYYTEVARWLFSVLTMGFFDLGLILVALTIYKTVSEKSDQERTEEERQDKLGKTFLKRAGIDPDRKCMRECVSCGKLIPLASETCEYCHTKQKRSKP
jgi:hypothetical protein